MQGIVQAIFARPEFPLATTGTLFCSFASVWELPYSQQPKFIPLCNSDTFCFSSVSSVKFPCAQKRPAPTFPFVSPKLWIELAADWFQESVVTNIPYFGGNFWIFYYLLFGASHDTLKQLSLDDWKYHSPHCSPLGLLNPQSNDIDYKTKLQEVLVSLSPLFYFRPLVLRFVGEHGCFGLLK